jgi:hypothetical protein
MRHRRGWVFLDVLMGMILISIIAATLGLAVGSYHRALMHLADLRSASTFAESALISLQTGETSHVPLNVKLEFHTLPAPPGIPGQTWVEVETTVGSRHATLVGLVPQRSLPGGGS